MTKFRKTLVSSALLALVVTISACSGSPTGPSTGNGGTTPSTGSVTVNFVQQPGATCKAVGTSFCNPNTQLGNRIQVNISWFDSTIGATGATQYQDSDYIVMAADGSATVTMGNIPKGRITIKVFNSWLCSSGVCGDEARTGRGITVNGVKLIDADSQTGFTFQPPSGVTP